MFQSIIKNIKILYIVLLLLLSI